MAEGTHDPGIPLSRVWGGLSDLTASAVLNSCIAPIVFETIFPVWIRATETVTKALTTGLHGLGLNLSSHSSVNPAESPLLLGPHLVEQEDSNTRAVAKIR